MNAIHLYVTILGVVEDWGILDVSMVPRQGEELFVSRADADHNLTVVKVIHHFGQFGHTIKLMCI